MNANKGKLMRIEYKKVDRLKVNITHVYREKNDKILLMIELPTNINESYYEYLLYKNNLYHIDDIEPWVYSKPNDNKNVYMIFNLTRTPYGTSGKEWEEIAGRNAEECRKLRKEIDNLKREKEEILDKLRDILDGE